VFVLYLNRPLLGKHRHHAGLRLAVLKNLDRFFPGGLLLVVDFTQIKNVTLNDAVPRAPLVFDDAPVTMFFAILLSRAAAQKHDGG
jgi:hypothetical protein